MAQTSWPFHDGTTGTPVLEDEWSIMARQWARPGVVDYSDRLEVFGDSGGRQVKVKPGRATVRGHWYESTAQEVLPIAANTSGSPRIDRVVLRLDPAANTMLLAVLEGTPAASPEPPILTQTDLAVFEVSLAQVAVADAVVTINADDVTDERQYSSPVAYQTTAPSSPAIALIWIDSDATA